MNTVLVAQNSDDFRSVPLQFASVTSRYPMINPASLCDKGNIFFVTGTQRHFTQGWNDIYSNYAGVGYKRSILRDARSRTNRNFIAVGAFADSDREGPYLQTTRATLISSFHYKLNDQRKNQTYLSFGMSVSGISKTIAPSVASAYNRQSFNGLIGAGVWLYQNNAQARRKNNHKRRRFTRLKSLGKPAETLNNSYRIGISLRNISLSQGIRILEQTDIALSQLNITAQKNIHFPNKQWKIVGETWLALTEDRQEFNLGIAPAYRTTLLKVSYFERQHRSYGGHKGYIFTFGVNDLEIGQDLSIGIEIAYALPFAGSHLLNTNTTEITLIIELKK